jgi:hypothetical protein
MENSPNRVTLMTAKANKMSPPVRQLDLHLIMRWAPPTPHLTNELIPISLHQIILALYVCMYRKTEVLACIQKYICLNLIVGIFMQRGEDFVFM